MNKKNKKGFTILELLVVVAIIAILAVIAIPQFMGAIDKSRVSAQIADLASVGKAVVMYNFDMSSFPEGTQTGLAVANAETEHGMIGNYTAGTGVTGNQTGMNILMNNQVIQARAAAAGTAVKGTTANSNWNGPYINTYPDKNKWGGTFEYQVVGITPDGDQATAGLATGRVVIKVTGIPNAQLQKIETAVDATVAANGYNAGVFRLNNATPATATIGYYIIK